MFKAALVTLAVGSAMSSELIKTPAGRKRVTGQYIVRLNNNENLDTLKTHLTEMKEALGGDMEELRVFEHLAEHKTLAYTARLSSRAVEKLLEQNIVSYVEEDQIVQIRDCKTENDAVWGLTRTNQRAYDVDSTPTTYEYTTGATGAGVDAYIIDTGIYCENNDFVNKKTGSCTFGFSSVYNWDGSLDTTDGNGHGTHVAGTVGSETYGVAKEVDLIAVKVMSDRGTGSSSAILDGINWVIGNAKKTGKLSVSNLSIGGGFSQTENDAIAAATNAGVVMVVAAGNDDKNACDYSPASEPLAVTVGATDDSNTRAYYSNYGSCLDVFGPGTDITSTWIGEPDATNTISGTSMASPHVCGVAAKIRSANPGMNATAVASKILADATPDVISDVKGSPDLMVYATCE